MQVLPACLVSMPVLAEEARNKRLTGTRRRVRKGLSHFANPASKQSQLLCLWPTFCAGIEYLLETKVASVDIKNKSLQLEKGGEDITYDKLIIATGSTVQTFCCKLIVLQEHISALQCMASRHSLGL